MVENESDYSFFATAGALAVYQDGEWIGWAALEEGDEIRKREIPYLYQGDVGRWPAGLIPTGKGTRPLAEPIILTAPEWREIVKTTGEQLPVQTAKDLVGWGNRGVSWTYAKRGIALGIRWICIIGYEGRGGSSSSRAYHLFLDVCGKIIYYEREPALVEADRLAEEALSQGIDKLMSVYWCQRCNGWHVGTSDSRPVVPGRPPLQAST